MAILVMDGTRHYVMMWFIAGPEQDYMAALWRTGDGPLTLTYRFRYYHSDDPVDTQDQKSVTQVTFAPGLKEERVLAYVDTIHDQLRAAGMRPASSEEDAGYFRVPLHTSDPERLGRVLQAQPWVHISKAGARDER